MKNKIKKIKIRTILILELLRQKRKVEEEKKCQMKKQYYLKIIAKIIKIINY